MKRAGAGVQCDAFLRAAIRGELPFEAGNLGSEDELRALQHSGDRSINFLLDASVLRLQIEIGNLDGRVGDERIGHAKPVLTLQQNVDHINLSITVETARVL